MLAIKTARKFIQANPDHPASKTIASLVFSLENVDQIPVKDLYDLDNDRFELALEILSEWRLDRHYASKLRLLDVSSQVQELNKADKSAS